jgi:ribonuclease P/MRP protein subunit POP5
MLKLKPLRPSLREKKRYLVYEIRGAETISFHNLQELLIIELNKMLGVFDSATAGIMPIKYNSQTRRGIIRLNHTAVLKVKACFVLLTTLAQEPVMVKSVGVSGILKKAKENFFNEAVVNTVKEE